MLEFYFRFRSRPFPRNRRVILHQDAEFRPNRNIRRWNMTSYPFLKMAAATAKYYFRFRICWCHCLQKVKVYKQTKFRRDISIGGWDITISVFEIQTTAMMEFYFRFRSRPFRRNLQVILHQAAKFRPNRNIRHWNMIHFSRCRPLTLLISRKLYNKRRTSSNSRISTPDPAVQLDCILLTFLNNLWLCNTGRWSNLNLQSLTSQL